MPESNGHITKGSRFVVLEHELFNGLMIEHAEWSSDGSELSLHCSSGRIYIVGAPYALPLWDYLTAGAAQITPQVEP